MYMYELYQLSTYMYMYMYMPMQCTYTCTFSTSSFLQAVITVANADSANTSLRDRMTFVTPQPQLLRKMAGLLHTQLQSGRGQRGGVSGDVVLHFWLHVLLSYPGWHKWVMMSCDVIVHYYIYMYMHVLIHVCCHMISCNIILL